MILATNDIAELIEHMRGLGVAEIEIAGGDEMLRVALPEAVEQSVRTASGPAIIAAAACGIFFLGHPARAVTLSPGPRSTPTRSSPGPRFLNAMPRAKASTMGKPNTQKIASGSR